MARPILQQVLPPRVARDLSRLRVLWVTLLFAPLGLVLCAAVLAPELDKAIAQGFTGRGWADAPPWDAWVVTAFLAAEALLLPSSLDASAVARLVSRVSPMVDPDGQLPFSYRSAPPRIPHASDALIASAFERYAVRLTLVFAFVLTIDLVALATFMTPVPHLCRGSFGHDLWRPRDYLLPVAVATLLLALRMPTRRGVLRILERVESVRCGELRGLLEARRPGQSKRNESTLARAQARRSVAPR